MKSKIVWITEHPDKCQHEPEYLSNIMFDILDQPYQICNKCGKEFCGRDAINALRYPLIKQSEVPYDDS